MKYAFYLTREFKETQIRNVLRSSRAFKGEA
jgi:hypothetical protein